MNRTKKSKRRNRNIILSVLLVLTLAVTGVLAYVTAGSKEDNVFTVGNVDVNLSEPLWDAQNTSGVLENIIPRQEIDKDPTLTNSGNNDAYVYMMVEIPKTYEIEIANDDGSYETKTHYPLFSIMNSEGKINEANENWTLIDSKVGTEADAYDYYLYGYNTAIKPEESVKLFDKVKFCNPSSKEAFVDVLTGKSIEDLEVKVTGYAIQNEYHNGEANSVESAWKLFTNQNGWSWPANRYSNIKTIDFVRENGQILHSIHFEDSAQLTLYDNSALDKEGYARKWVDKATGEDAIAGTTITEDTIYVLEYTKMKSLVFEDAEGNVLKTEYFTGNKSVTLYSDASLNKVGYTLGWTNKTTGQQVVSGDIITENTTLVATYTAMNYVRYEDEQGNVLHTEYFEDNITIAKLYVDESLAKEGHTFAWTNKETNEVVDDNTTFNKNTILVPQYTEMNYIKYEDEQGNIVHKEYFDDSTSIYPYFDETLAKDGYTFEWINKETNEVIISGETITQKTTYVPAYTETGYGTNFSDYFIFDLHSTYKTQELYISINDLDANHPNYPTEPTSVLIPSKVTFTVPNNFNINSTSEQTISADYGSVNVNEAYANSLEPGKTYTICVTEDYVYDWSGHVDIIEALIFPDTVACYQVDSLTNSSVLKEVCLPYLTDGFWNCYEFENCIALETVHISSFCMYIGANSFAGCTNLSNINLTDSIWAIDSSAFLNCSSLTNIRIPRYPEDYVEILDNAFSGCTGLTDVYFSGSEEEWNTPEILTIHEGNEPLLNATIHYNS